MATSKKSAKKPRRAKPSVAARPINGVPHMRLAAVDDSPAKPREESCGGNATPPARETRDQYRDELGAHWTAMTKIENELQNALPLAAAYIGFVARTRGACWAFANGGPAKLETLLREAMVYLEGTRKDLSDRIKSVAPAALAKAHKGTPHPVAEGGRVLKT